MPPQSLQMTPSWASVDLLPAEASGQAGLMGKGPGRALGSQQPHATLQAGGGMAGKLPSGRGPGCAD